MPFTHRNLTHYVLDKQSAVRSRDSEIPPTKEINAPYLRVDTYLSESAIIFTFAEVICSRNKGTP